ncbi:MAG: hypothetical protein Q8920_12795 [Bacillota bacterium]|nr:hypothetical protein [Bacillota bacterium]
MINALAECCEITIQLLDRLLKAGIITQEEYEKEIRLKKDFLNNFINIKKGSETN